MELNADKLKKMVRAIVTTRDDEIGCGECFAQVDVFIEMQLQGKDAAEAMPLVQEHLNRCKNCLDEFEALVNAIKSSSR